MQQDHIAYNRISRLAVDLTPAAFACLVSFDGDSSEVQVESVSGTGTQIFSQTLATARRAVAEWTPSVKVNANTNLSLQKVFLNQQQVTSHVRDILEGVVNRALFNSTFKKFEDYECLAIPIVFKGAAWGALFFVSSTHFTRASETKCVDFVSQTQRSLNSVQDERELTVEINRLSEMRRRVQLDDPLGLTQRKTSAANAPRSFGDIRLSTDSQTAQRGERDLNLTRREFDLLDTFLQSPGAALSRVQIISRVWGDKNGVSSNVMNVTIKHLREKLEADGEPRVIHSLRGYGYVLRA